MKSPSKDQQAERDRLIAALTAAESEIETAIARYNSHLGEHRDEITAVVAVYNELVADADALRNWAEADIQEYMNDRSEKWQEGERGQAYEVWRQSFENLDLSGIGIEVELPDDLEEPSFDARAVLEQEWESEVAE